MRPVTVLQGIAVELIRNLDGQLKVEVVQQAAFYEHRLQVCVAVREIFSLNCLQCGSKAIFHIEAFLAKFMSIYKHYLLEVLA